MVISAAEGGASDLEPVHRAVVLRGAVQLYDHVVVGRVLRVEAGAPSEFPFLDPLVCSLAVEEPITGGFHAGEEITFETKASPNFAGPEEGRRGLFFLYRCGGGALQEMPILRAIVLGDSAEISGARATSPWRALRDSVIAFRDEGNPAALRDAADAIVRGFVRGVYLSRADTPDFAWGALDLEVTETLRGSGPARGSTRLRIVIPEPEEFSFANYPLPGFQSGEEVLVFLRRHRDEWRLAGGVWSKWTIEEGEARAFHLGVPCERDTVLRAAHPIEELLRVIGEAP